MVISDKGEYPVSCLIGFIGCGNMGGALASAVCEIVGRENVYISGKNQDKLSETAKKLGVIKSTNEEIIKKCKFVFLGVKPQMLNDVITPLAQYIKERKDDIVLISMAAGVSLEKICLMAGESVPAIRIMPNTPVAVGEGVVLYCTNSKVKDADEKTFLDFMASAGLVDHIDEKLIDAASAVSGCGPAFAYMFMEALSDGAVECGLPREKALKYASQMLLGSAKLLQKTGEHPGKLKDNVCSPGGSTIKGVHALENNGFRNGVIDAVKASYERTVELGK